MYIIYMWVLQATLYRLADESLGEEAWFGEEIRN
jgi:hypothetical protein